MTITINHFKTRVVRYPLFALGLACTLITTGLHAGLNTAEWAYWIAAVGTVGTLLGTTWLATSETRRRERREAARGFIVAAALAPRLKMLAFQISCFRGALTFTDWDDMLHGSPHEIAADFVNIGYEPASTEELLALESMSDNCATKLAYAQSQFSMVKSDIEAYVQGMGNPDRPLPPSIARIWLEWVVDLGDRINEITRQMNDAAQTHAIAPSQLDLYGEDDE
ncbi:hypothetical protein [Janthinobacterium lividum]|uniref:hypothetical protein n=1 Tax=Janthinobacterium lividum TaxID=29581 RepID=UPI00159538A5|nr:hypothetical protein [Janthinobacterium lividum]QKY08752.1 hypothetical protein G8765_13970 [Janthinobacterium lividum]